MNSLFNELIAARLQYLTFPLEFVGLTLALIEVRFPKAATYLTQQIERLSIPIQEIRAGQTGNDSVMERSLEVFLSRLLTAGLLVLTVVNLVRVAYLLASQGFAWETLTSELIAYLVYAIVTTLFLLLLGLTTFFLVTGSSDFARRFVAGRAIGTLGILIAGLGLLGEFYQLLTQLVH